MTLTRTRHCPRDTTWKNHHTAHTAPLPSCLLRRHLSPPGRHQFHRASHDGGFDRDMGFERMPGGRMPGFDRQPPMDRFGGFDRQPPFERRWRSRSPTPERSRSRSLSRRERARSPIVPADGFSRPGHRDDRLLDRAGADRHVERRISSDVASWREEPSWKEQDSWREEPVVKHEHRRASRSEVEALRQREREGLHSSGDGRHMQDELPHDQRKVSAGAHVRCHVMACQLHTQVPEQCLSADDWQLACSCWATLNTMPVIWTVRDIFVYVLALTISYQGHLLLKNNVHVLRRPIAVMVRSAVTNTAAALNAHMPAQQSGQVLML